MTRSRLLLAAAAAAACAGCASYAGLQGARALGDGQVRQGLFGTGALAVGDGTTAGITPEYVFRAGLGDGLEYGFRAFALGLTGDLKEEIVRSGRFTLSWSPSASVFAVSRTRSDAGSFQLAPIGASNAGAALLLGLRMPGGELTVAPRVLGQVQQGRRAEDRASLALLTGLSAGASVEFLPFARVVYEASFLWVAAARGSFAPFTRPGLVPYGAGSVFAQLTIGIAFGD